MDTTTTLNIPPPLSHALGWTRADEPLIPPIELLETVQWQRISIITPSYNQGHFIEETIRSVLLQGYPNLEYIVIDGGSTDRTVDILTYYSPWITYWVSEPDRGQAHAINKGLAQATGTILAYLNSDDYYLPGTCFHIAQQISRVPDADLIHGQCRYINVVGDRVGEQIGTIKTFQEILNVWEIWWQKQQFVQPEVFWTQRITTEIGLFRDDLSYAMDYDYWCRILRAGGKVTSLDTELACFRFSPTQKSCQKIAVATEILAIIQPHLWDRKVELSFIYRLKLQGQWLYQSLFLTCVEQSIFNQDAPLMRWVKLLSLTLTYPQILLAPNFQSRIQHWIARFLITARQT